MIVCRYFIDATYRATLPATDKASVHLMQMHASERSSSFLIKRKKKKNLYKKEPVKSELITSQ